MKQLRCPNTMHGELDEESGILEVKCTSKRCGAGNGVIVMHKFDLHTGKMLDTKKFSDPVIPIGIERREHASHR